jgi:hypothetical protein
MNEMVVTGFLIVTLFALLGSGVWIGLTLAGVAWIGMELFSSRSAGDTAGLGASSMIFWCRRCTEQSRSPRWMQWPCASANTCTSTWRGRSRARSISRSPLPKPARASERALCSAGRSWAMSVTSRMPRPPPPATAFTMSGKPRRAASASNTSGLWSAPA